MYKGINNSENLSQSHMAIDGDAVDADAKSISPGAVPALRQKAQAGDARAQMEYGDVVESGYGGVNPNAQEAFRWYSRN